MYGTLNKNHWVPTYPEMKDSPVDLGHDELTLCFYKQLPIIYIQDRCTVVEDPACFWIDKHHIYLRSSWSSWTTVDESESELVETLLKCKYCYVGINQDDYNYKYAVVPVYHITRLPADLFDKVSYGEERSERLIVRDDQELDEDETFLFEYMDLFGPSEQDDALLKAHSFFWKELSQFAYRFRERLEFKFNAKVRNNVADLMITKKGDCVMMLDFLKDDELEDVDAHIVKLRRMRLYFKARNPKVCSQIGLVVSESAQEKLIGKDLSDLHLIVRGNLRKKLFDFFFLK
ncbi:hypothetical protein IKW72_08955 [bacterium]|nr:hypothetical protein [bacterium]MBR5625108.1 hypothetical protein [bacterium]